MSFSRVFSSTATDRVVVGHDATIQPTAAFTFDAWLTVDDIESDSNQKHIVSKWQSYLLRQVNNGSGGATFKFTVVTSSDQELSGHTIVGGRRYHVACVYDPVAGSQKMRVYDSVTDTATNYTRTPTGALSTSSTNDLLIGNYQGLLDLYDFRGQVETVRFWKGLALTDAEIDAERNRIVPVAGNAACTLALWLGQSDPEIDYSGNGNTGAVTGATSSDVASVFEETAVGLTGHKVRGSDVSFTKIDATVNTISSRSWDFGDGTTSISADPTHTYAHPGTYTVTYTATDDQANEDSDTRRVTVAGTGWLYGFTHRLQVDLTPSVTTALGDWVQFATTNAGIVGVPQGDGDVAVVVKATGERLPVEVITNNGTTLRISVALPGPSDTGAAVECWLYAKGDADAAWSPQLWGGTYAAPTDDGPSIDFYDGVSANSGASTAWVHPNVMRVEHIQSGEPGYWLRFLDGAEVSGASPSVTHIRVDTPYPGGNVQYENPYLLYSTDDCQTWSEWPGVTNPIDPYPGSPDNNSDVGFTILSDGSLFVGWRDTAPVGGAFAMRVRTVSGTHLSSVTVGSESSPTIPDDRLLSPSFLAVGSTVHCFLSNEDDLEVTHWTSTDSGATWTNQGTVIAATSSGTGEYAADRDYWHGGIMQQAIGGWYYMVWSEGPGAAHTTPFHDFRVYRSADLATWEPAWDVTVAKGQSPLMQSGAYMGCPFLYDGDEVGLYLSGQGVGGYRAGHVYADFVTPHDTTLADAFTRGIGHSTTYASSGDRGSVSEVGSVETLSSGGRRGLPGRRAPGIGVWIGV